MSVEELLQKLDALGVTLVASGPRMILRLPIGVPQRVRDEIAAAAKQHRDVVLRHLGAGDNEPPEEGAFCGVCRAWDYSGDDPVGVWGCCRRADCPRWRPGDGPAWLAAYRSRFTRR